MNFVNHSSVKNIRTPITEYSETSHNNYRWSLSHFEPVATVLLHFLTELVTDNDENTRPRTHVSKASYVRPSPYHQTSR